VNNETTARATRRTSETREVIVLELLGLIKREGQGQFAATKKLLQLNTARKKRDMGETLSPEEEALLAECAPAITN
jgi:hypothetical protein